MLSGFQDYQGDQIAWLGVRGREVRDEEARDLNKRLSQAPLNNQVFFHQVFS